MGAQLSFEGITYIISASTVVLRNVIRILLHIAPLPLVLRKVILLLSVSVVRCPRLLGLMSLHMNHRLMRRLERRVSVYSNSLLVITSLLKFSIILKYMSSNFLHK